MASYRKPGDFSLFPYSFFTCSLGISEQSGCTDFLYFLSRLHSNQVAPGKRSPTVSQLDTDGWVAVQSLILKKDSSRVMDELQACGAKDILLFTLHNTRIT